MDGFFGFAVFLALLVTTAAQPGSPPVHGAHAIDKVVNLLADLKSSIQEDGSKDQKVYDKYSCWCETMTSGRLRPSSS